MKSGDRVCEHTSWGTRILIDSPQSNMVRIIGDCQPRFQPVQVSCQVTALSCDQSINVDNVVAGMMKSERLSVSLQVVFHGPHASKTENRLSRVANHNDTGMRRTRNRGLHDESFH